VTTFGSTNVTLTSEMNTDYTCSYGSNHYSILNVTDSKSFTIQGGILKYGNGDLKFYFIIVNGTGGESLCFSSMEIEFVSAMNSMVFILGGKVTLEDIKINNQLDTNWVSPLVFSYSSTSSVTVNLYSCAITNSSYKSPDSIPRSAIVFFINRSESNRPISFNMSFFTCHNTTINLDNSQSMGGGVCSFYSRSSSPGSGFLFFFKKKKIRSKRNFF
jgi:hypothetical protein